MNKVTKNFFYNSLYQILLSILPTIMMPYLARTLGSESLGIYSYTNSVVLLFCTFGMLGLSTYSNREVAYSSTKGKKELSKTFESLCILRLLLFIICLAVYYNMLCNSQYKVYFILHIFLLTYYFFDISWFFVGVEEMKTVAIRNSIIKIISTILTLCLVKSTNDLEIYIVINGGSALLGIFIVLPKIKKYVQRVKLKQSDITKHVFPVIKLFLPQAAISLYTLLDKTMIKWLTSDVTSVGYYDQSQNLIKMTLIIATSLSTVLLPRISNEYAKGNMAQIKIYLDNSINILLLTSFPLMFGTIGISSEFIPWFLGKEFSPCIHSLQILAFTILPISLTNVTGVEYLVALNETRKLTVSYATAAIANITLNLILIPHLGIVGAALGTICAEFTVLFIQYFYMQQKIGEIYLLKKSIASLLSSIVMLFIVKYIGKLLKVGIKTTFIQIIIGALCYILCMLLLKAEIITQLIDNVKKAHYVLRKEEHKDD